MAAASQPDHHHLRLVDEIAEDEHDGVSGFFVTWRGWDAIELDHEREIGKWRIKVGRLEVDVQLQTTENTALRKSAATFEWRATYGPWLGFAGGLTIGGILAAIIGGVLGRLPAIIGAGQR